MRRNDRYGPNRSYTRRVRCPAVLALLAVLSCGGSSGTPVSASLFREWFIASGATAPPGLTATTAGTFDSLREVVRRESREGSSSVVIADTFGVRYTVGYTTPAAYENDSLYPCVIYLHGGIGTTRNDKGEHAWEMLRILSDSMDLFLVSPSGNRSSPWWSPAGLSRILQTLRFMTMHFPVNPDKVFLAGVSDGATGCWAAANTIAAPFAGFIAISGFGGMLPRLGMELRPENLMQRPIYNVNAGRDRLYPVATVRSFLDGLERQGVGIRRKEYPEEEHGFDYRDREWGTLCSLLREWSLPDTRGINWFVQGTHPFCISGIIAVERSGSGPFFIHEYPRNDSIFLQTGGIDGLQIYFDMETNSRGSRIFSINNSGSRRIRPKTPDGNMLLRYMKQCCFPVITGGEVYTISL